MARAKVNPVTVTGNNPGIKELTGEQKAGVTLAYIVLGLIFGVLLSLTVLFYTDEFDGAGKIYETLTPLSVSDSAFAKRVEQVRLFTQEKREYRQFIIGSHQHILGVLIPMLTSILGYIFWDQNKGIISDRSACLCIAGTTFNHVHQSIKRIERFSLEDHFGAEEDHADSEGDVETFDESCC